MNEDYKKRLISQIIEREDKNGCWNVLEKDDPRSAEWNYYVPTYKSTLWTLIFIAEINYAPMKSRFLKPLGIMSKFFFDKESGIFSIGKSHFPIPCLNGNMLYLHNYFESENDEVVHGIIDFFHKYQRFDDGDFKTPAAYPYFSNKSCYGKHTCYWGIVKLLKGLSFLPENKRSIQAKGLIDKCIGFILKHHVCYSSKNKNNFLDKNIELLTFPNMYQSDFLEILWLLKREGIQSKEMNKALELLKAKRNEKGTWEIEYPVKNLVIPFGKRSNGNDLISERAQEVYGNL